jgi:predicted transposase YdaD
VTNPHDSLFRLTFSQVHHAEGLLRFLLREEPLATAIDWTALRAYPTATADQGLRLHHADLVFKAKLRGTPPETVFFLLEHKSAPDEALLRQLHRYVMHIVNEWERAEATVPIVVPVVVHHGMRRFTAAWSAVRRTDLGRAVRASAVSFQPRLRFLLDDLTVRTEAEILTRPLSAMARMTQLCLGFVARMTDEAVLAALDRWSAVISGVDAAKDARQCVGALSSYLHRVTNLPAPRLAATLARMVSKANEDSVMSTADKLIAEGRAQGRSQGRAQGRAEGRAQGKVELILRQLTARFGPPPAEVTARVRSAPSAALDRWAVRILDARTLAEVFADE